MTSQAVQGTMGSVVNALIIHSMLWGNWVQVLVLYEWDQTADPHVPC